MCMVSNIHDYGLDSWGKKFPNYPVGPNTNPWKYTPPHIPDAPPKSNAELLKEMRDFLEEFKKMIKAAEEFDKATKQPDCESAEKTAWMKDIEERLKKLEKVINPKMRKVPQ